MGWLTTKLCRPESSFMHTTDVATRGLVCKSESKAGLIETIVPTFDHVRGFGERGWKWGEYDRPGPLAIAMLNTEQPWSWGNQGWCGHDSQTKHVCHFSSPSSPEPKWEESDKSGITRSYLWCWNPIVFLMKSSRLIGCLLSLQRVRYDFKWDPIKVSCVQYE